LGLGSDAGLLALCQLSLSWTNSSDDPLVNTVVESLIKAIEAATKEAGLFNNFKYLNYAAAFQDPFEGYGEISKARLVATSKKYDPTALFQNAVTGGFKLFGKMSR